MDEEQRKTEEELNELKHEMEAFIREKERVKAIVGSIGGVPTFNTKLFNILFTVLIISCLIVSIFSEGKLSMFMIDLALGGISFKIMYLMHQQARVNHFQLWILSSLEWRISEAVKSINELKKKDSE